MAADTTPYGDVAYADPGYQSDKKKRYPIDTAEHVKAAWSYINQGDNASQYSAEQLAEIKGKIKAAAKKFGITIADSSEKSAPPRENLVRVMPMAFELRKAEDSDMPVMVGTFAPIGTWTEIHSSWEGDFVENVARGACTKTFAENRQNMRVLFQHGQDPSVGEKPLGMIADLREEADAHHFEVPLFDTSYNRDLIPGLQAGAYGTSWRMAVTKERFNRNVKASDYNPNGLPERTILEMRVAEFGPVTFPAYPTAQVGVRSATDDYILRKLGNDPERLRELLQQHMALQVTGAESSHSDEKEAAPVAPAAVVNPRFKTREDFQQWLSSRKT